MKPGWKTVKLGEVCDFERGLTYSKSDEAEAPGITVLRANNVDLASGRLNLDDLRYISARVVVDEKKYLSANSIIVCTASGSRDHLGKTAHISNPPRMTFGGFMGLLRPSREIDSLFLFYLTRSDLYRSFISSLSSGTNINNLKGSDLLSWEIPLPPLAEQKQIVALLDEAFAGIDKAKANVEARIQALNTLVVSEFQSLVDKSGFERKRLPELASHTLGKMLDKRKNTGTPRPYLRNVNVRWFEFDLSDIHEMPIRDEEITRCQARKGDVLMCEGGYPGRCAIWDKDEPVFFQKALHRIRFTEKWMAEWFVNYMHSLDSAGKLAEFFTGTGIQHLTGETLSKFMIPVPPKPELETYVKRISTIRTETNNLMATEAAKLEALSDLKSSILAQSFAGELPA